MSEISRLRWLCRRGMKELDVVMTRYLERNYEKSSDAEKRCFRTLLEKSDPELNDLILGRQISDDKDQDKMMQIIRHMALPG